VLSWQQATGEHRQQLKWLAAGATVTIGIGLIASAASTGILQPVLDVGAAALPVSMGVGMDSVRDDLTTVVQLTLEPAHVSVWIRRLDETGNQLPRPVNVPR
jgi:hypothetical protein